MEDDARDNSAPTNIEIKGALAQFGKRRRVKFKSKDKISPYFGTSGFGGKVSKRGKVNAFTNRNSRQMPVDALHQQQAVNRLASENIPSNPFDRYKQRELAQDQGYQDSAGAFFVKVKDLDQEKLQTLDAYNIQRGFKWATKPNF